MTRRGAGGLALSPSHQADRAAAPRRGARPRPAPYPQRSLQGRGQGRSRTGLLRPPPTWEARPPVPAWPGGPAQPTHCGSAGPPEAALPPLPARGVPPRRPLRPAPGLSSKPGRFHPARQPRGRPLSEGGPQTEARSSGARPGLPGARAARTRLGGSLRGGEMPAPERRGWEGKRSRESRSRAEGGRRKRWRARKAEKRGEGEKAEGKDRRDGGRDVPGPGPFTGFRLAGPSPAQGQGSPNCTCLLPAPGLAFRPRASRGRSLPRSHT